MSIQVAEPTMTREEALDGMFSRLYNFKFTSALRYLDEYPDLTPKADVIRMLSRLFGNCGGIDGDMGTLVGCALESIPGFLDYIRSEPHSAYNWGLISKEDYDAITAALWKEKHG